MTSCAEIFRKNENELSDRLVDQSPGSKNEPFKSNGRSSDEMYELLQCLLAGMRQLVIMHDGSLYWEQEVGRQGAFGVLTCSEAAPV